MFRPTLFLLLLAGFASPAQSPYNVLPWKANTTLHSYLMQDLHQQYARRTTALTQATATAAGTHAYHDSVRARFRRVLGPLPATRTPLRAQTTGTLQRRGFRVEKVIFESTPHHHVTANLYVPAGRGQHPAVLFPCGHEAEGKATRSYQQAALLLTTHGFVVLVPDPVSQGERLQLTDATGQPLARGGTTEHTLLNAQANLLGRTLAAAELWDNVRGLDYLATRPEVDTARLGCLGNSGGATQTAYLMAYDPRLKAAALCSYVAAGERNLELTGPADGCVMLPGAGAARLDIGDWLIAFAPKPLLVLAGKFDFVDYQSIESACNEVEEVCAALNHPLPGPPLDAFPDGHGLSKPKREAVLHWFQHELQGFRGPVYDTEGELPVATAPELQCTATGQVNTSFADEENLSAFYRAEAQRLATARPVLAPAGLALAVSAQLGEAARRAFEPSGYRRYQRVVDAEILDYVSRAGLSFRKLVLRNGRDLPLPALPLPALRLEARSEDKPTNRVLLCFADSGKAALAGRAAWLHTQLKTYQTVLLIDLRGQGETADPAAANDPKYYNREYRPALLALHLGHPLLAQRMHDLGTALEYLDADYRPVDVYADGPTAARVALYAAVLTPRIAQVYLAALPPSYPELLARPTTRDTYSDVLPGVLQHYDLPDLVRVLGARLVLP